MTEPRELLDDDAAVERILRRTFAEDAAGTSLPADLHGLAHGAARRGRAHRRRIAGLTAALSVVAVTSVALVGGLGQGADRGEAPGGVGQSAPSLPSETAPPPAQNEEGRPVLMFRGVEVTVPASMLDPSAVRCGSPVQDAAYVEDNALPVEACAVHVDQSGLTTVVMRPLEDVPQAARDAGGRRVADGRYQVASAIPGRDVWLAVTSPDQERADRLFGTAWIDPGPYACDVRITSTPEVGGAGPLVPTTLSAGAIGRVCGYRSGWLTGAGLLSHDRAVDLADLVGAAPSDALLDCVQRGYTGTGWWITVGDSRVWVEGGGCARVIGAQGGSGRVTDVLASTLWALAPGPGSMEGVVSAKD